ncbi:MAG: prepilin-type N-terminal cleavage/methylation domain-containing protein, partial [Candidatus Acidiferrales bacterium]
MKTARTHSKQAGFTLVELMVSISIFVLLSAAMFGLLNLSQKRSQTESQVLASFEEARLGLDQIVRDVSAAGYPPLNHFFAVPAANLYAASPVAWSPNYTPATPCLIGTAGGGTCASPGDFDLIVETDINPDANDG